MRHMSNAILAQAFATRFFSELRDRFRETHVRNMTVDRVLSLDHNLATSMRALVHGSFCEGLVACSCACGHSASPAYRQEAKKAKPAGGAVKAALKVLAGWDDLGPEAPRELVPPLPAPSAARPASHGKSSQPPCDMSDMSRRSQLGSGSRYSVDLRGELVLASGAASCARSFAKTDLGSSILEFLKHGATSGHPFAASKNVV